ncbi:MAG: DNA-binding protein [Erythrobacter sp.]|nr:DNA-binding protein [Erythrobacter sp.]|tara:strand:- start:3528 stop:3719 length:192 start_codon:yes stop_codon:yes gene_type:complete
MRELLTTDQAAPYAGVAAKTLQNWRVLGQGPAFLKIGTKVKYDPNDIDTWLAACRRHSTSEAM